jgi:hypothetical protein
MLTLVTQLLEGLLVRTITSLECPVSQVLMCRMTSVRTHDMEAPLKISLQVLRKKKNNCGTLWLLRVIAAIMHPNTTRYQFKVYSETAI